MAFAALASCLSDRISYVILTPDTIPRPGTLRIQDEDLGRFFGIVEEVALHFGFHRLKYSPEGNRIQANSLASMGLENAPQYGRSVGAAYMLLQIGVPVSRAEIRVAASLVRGGSKSHAAVLAEVQDAVANRLRESFPDWSVTRQTGEIDRTFAP